MDRESLDRLRFDRRLQSRRGWLAPGELDRMKALVRERMEGAVALRVPLHVELGAGPDWLSAH